MKYTRPSTLLAKMDILNYESSCLLNTLEPSLYKNEERMCELLVDLCLKHVQVIKQEINEDASFEIDDLIHATRMARLYVDDYLNNI